MHFIPPLTEDEKRRRRRDSGMVENGEVIGFDLAFRDAAPAGGRVFFTDQLADSVLASHRAMRDAARDAQYDLPPKAALHDTGDRVAHTSLSVGDARAMVRDLARASQFGG